MWVRGAAQRAATPFHVAAPHSGELFARVVGQTSRARCRIVWRCGGIEFAAHQRLGWAQAGRRGPKFCLVSGHWPPAQRSHV